MDPSVGNVTLHCRGQFEKILMLIFCAEAHDIFNASAVIPTAVEDHDFSSSRKMLHVTLNIHLRLLAVGWRRQCNNAKDTRAHTFGNSADCSPLASAVAAL